MNRVVAIGEAMVEMAPVGDGLYRRGYAGDTFNTVWHMAQLLDGDVGFVTRVGLDAVSDAFVAELAADGLDVSGIGRDAARTMGLYLVELDGAERSFQYWRDQSAARLLTEDERWLAAAVKGTKLIHLSGITLAILSDAARGRLLSVLRGARADGAKVSFDPNIRPRLWASLDEARAVISAFLAQSDIALPSFDDEAATWGDASPDVTLARFAEAGVAEVVVKNGAGPVVWSGGAADTPAVADAVDTTGAGDAFNAGYLAARLEGADIRVAIAAGQDLSGRVIRHFGARLPKSAMC